MNKWLIGGLLTALIVVWSLVVVVALQQEETVLANNHSISLPPHESLKESADSLSTSRWEETQQETHTDEPKTIIGTHLTPEWVSDVSEDGVLSIDTLLSSLDLTDESDLSIQ